MSSLPPASLLRTLLDYDPLAGSFVWRPRTPEMMNPTAGHTADHVCAKWNGQFAGREAFTYRRADGYFYGQIFRRSYGAHRIAWAISHGEWPAGDVDHINGDRSDNRLSNLRVVTRTGNMRNMGRSSRNRSGATGVYRYRDGQRWYATIRARGAPKHLGIFPTFEAACAARAAAERDLGFHPNHGQSRKERA